MNKPIAIIISNFKPENRDMNIAALQAALFTIPGVVSINGDKQVSYYSDTNKINSITITKMSNGKAEMYRHGGFFTPAEAIAQGFDVIDPTCSGVFTMNDVVRRVRDYVEGSKQEKAQKIVDEYLAKVEVLAAEVNKKIAALN